MGFLFLSLLTSLGNSPEWKGLLQYQKSTIGLERSEVDGDEFFFSRQGATDPVDELKKTIEAFQKPVVEDQDHEDNSHAICKYPSRFRFVQEHFHLKNLPAPKCKSYHNYRSRIQTKKLSVVFSSYYLGSASSAFGHSFLRFSGTNENELFDTGINFAATPTTSNPILYALDGLIGVFPATFSAQPYFYKVREYNDFESRDLWSYGLNLTQAERDAILDHLWELGNTHYNYFYFNENCSYHILRAIEGAVPRIHFFDHRPVYLIPSASIKLIYSVPGMVTDIAYRPSIRSTAFARYAALTSEQQQDVLHAIREKSVPTTQVKNVAVLDTLMDAIDLNYASELIAADPMITAWKQNVLQARASIEEVSNPQEVVTPSNESPHLGHGSKRLVLGYGERALNASKSETFLKMQLRASHHDLLDPSIGYPRHLHIDFGRVGFEYLNQSKRFLLDELDLVDLTALSLNHPLISKISYAGRIGYHRSWIADCSDPLHCGAIRVKAGVGETYSFLKNHTVYFMLSGEPSYGFDYVGSKFKILTGPELNFLFEFTPSLKLLLQGKAGYRIFADHPFGTESSAETRFVFGNRFGLDLRAEIATQAAQALSEFSVKGMYYF